MNWLFARQLRPFVLLAGGASLLLNLALLMPSIYMVQVFDRVFASGSLDALRDSMERGESVRAFAGYAGWAPGQLDGEVARGDWMIADADSEAVFARNPGGVWSDLVERLSGDWAGRLAFTR